MMKLDRVIPFAGLALAACAPAATEHPNVIYVFPDQFRNASLGFWSDPEYAEQVAWRGDPVLTPNLDRFAGEEAVLVGDEGPFRVPRSALPPNAREGDVLVPTDGRYLPDPAKTAERRAAMRARLRRLTGQTHRNP